MTKLERLKQIEEQEGIDFIARFACLMEAVEMTCEKAEELGINPETSNLWIKPLVFQRYIDERYKDMKHRISDFTQGKEDIKDRSME